MKKRVISAALICIMLLAPFILSSCGDPPPPEPIPAKVYTLYTICGEGTTQEAIKEVELSLNRIIFYQLGVNVKLIMVTEDEYDELIEKNLAEVKAYEEAKKKKPSKNTSGESNDSAADSSSNNGKNESSEVLTGEDYISMLERGEEYVLQRPRVDIFLVKGYDKYIDLVGKELLADLTEKIKTEGKLIQDYVFPSFIEAAKVPNAKGIRKVYGIPMNKGIGKYDYIVFDKEYLDKYEVDADTMTNLWDLEYYLKTIAENEPELVPLGNIFDAPEVAYLFDDGFTSYIKNGTTVEETYKDNSVLDYFTLIARYRAMGYLQNEGENSRWAVKFVRGTFEDIERLEKENNHNYDYAIHSYPVATNEDLLETLFCVSTYTVADELNDVVELLEYIESNPAAANLLLHGVAGTHYELDEKNQVVRLSNDYNMEVKYTGNAFLTYTYKGENPDKWEKLKVQNIDSLKTTMQSASLGFAYYPVGIKNPNNNSELIYEPNYVNIIKEHTAAFYPDLINGTILDVEWQDIVDLVGPKVADALTKDIKTRYENEFNAVVLAEKAEKYAKGTALYTKIEEAAYKKAWEYYYTTSNKNNIRKNVKAAEAAKPENAGLSDSELDALVNQICTDEYMIQQIQTSFSKQIEEKKLVEINKYVTTQTNTDFNAYKDTDEYKARLDAVLNSEEYLEEILNATGENVFESHFDLCLVEINAYLQGLIKERIDAFFVELNADLKDKYIKFQNEYIAMFPFDDPQARSIPDYRIAISNVVEEAKKDRVSMTSALRTELTNIVRAELGEGALNEDVNNTVKERLTDAWIQNVVMETFAYNSDPNTQIKDSTENLRAIVNDYITLAIVEDMYDDVILGSFEKAIGLIRTIDVDLTAGAAKGNGGNNGDTSDEPGDQTSDDASDDTSGGSGGNGDGGGEEEPLVDIETVELYPLIFKKRIEKQYYTYKPLPTV